MRIPVDLLGRLDRLSGRLGIPRAAVIRKLLAEGIERAERENQ